MKLFKDIVAGLWSALCIGVTVLWEESVYFWNKISDTKKSLILAVVIIVVALLAASAVGAENAPDSNFGGFTTEDGRTVFMCYLSTNSTQVGDIYTCLVMFPVAPGILGAQGMVSHCTIKNYLDDKPFVSFGVYDEMRLLSGGI